MRAILMYHSIDASGSPISIAPEAFRAHRQWLTSGRVRAVPLDAVMSQPDAGGDAVAVTFDDGFENTAGEIASLLVEGVPVTIFVVSRHVGGTNAWGGRPQRGIPTLPLLDWAGLERLAGLGAALEAHTRTHGHLTDLPDEALDGELGGCADDLQERLGVQGGHIAYPYGDVDERVAARAARHFRFGHTTDFNVLSAVVPAMRCPRLDMFYFRDPGAIEAWGSPGFARRLRRIRAQRAVRRRLGGFWRW